MLALFFQREQIAVTFLSLEPFLQNGGSTSSLQRSPLPSRDWRRGKEAPTSSTGNVGVSLHSDQDSVTGLLLAGIGVWPRRIFVLLALEDWTLAESFYSM